MNERWIILHTQFSHRLDKFLIDELSAVAETDDKGRLIVFKTLDEASAHQEENAINGQCISIPLYD